MPGQLHFGNDAQNICNLVKNPSAYVNLFIQFLKIFKLLKNEQEMIEIQDSE